MPKPVCVRCQRFFRPHRGGAHVLEKKPKGGVQQPQGTEAPKMWEPYKVWMCDTWMCKGCGTVIAVGFGQIPIWEDYKGPLPDGQYLPVNDC
jgi:hypothetical protein